MKKFNLRYFKECKNPEIYLREMLDIMTEKNWNSVSKCQNLSESFIREFKDKVEWEYISKYQNLSEDFIREFRDKVDWDYISEYQKLSEDFIREFKDEVNWEIISECQILSEDFIVEFENKITFSRPNIIFNRDIKHYNPCKIGAMEYLSHTKKDEEISWNTLLESHSNKYDIIWLVDRIIKE